MSKGGTHWRAKFRVEKRGGGGSPRSRYQARLAKRQAEQSHKERWLVCDLFRGDDINAPLKFFKELGRVQKTLAAQPLARAVFWRSVRDAIAGVLIDLTQDFDSPDAHRVMGEIEAVIEPSNEDPHPLTRPALIVADPTLFPNDPRPHELDPVLRQVADDFTDALTDEEISKNNL